MVVRLTDKALIRRRLARAIRRATPGADFLLARAVEDLAERLGAVERRFEIGVAHGGVDERLARAMLATGRVARVVRLERTPTAFAAAAGAVADEEALPLRSRPGRSTFSSPRSSCNGQTICPARCCRSGKPCVRTGSSSPP
jgi:hypothetical protein